MSPIDEPASFEPKAAQPEARRSKTTAAEPAANADLVSVTIEPASGRLVKVERVDAAGVRHELSKEDRARLAGPEAKATLQSVLEQAFEAGIECVLGDSGLKEAAESQEDAELSRVLLRALFERSGAGRLMQGEVLNRAIVGALIEDAATSGAAAH
jgi:hypothetical protein